MGFDLSSSFLKTDRALEHFKALKAINERLREKTRVHEGLAEKEFNRKQGCWVFTAQNVIEFPATASPVLGDYLSNLRSALDHVAWQLVLSGREPLPKNPEVVYFPLYTIGRSATQGRGFWANHKRRLPGVGKEHLAIIERYQPYPRRKNLRPLALLARLSNDDKHRAVLPLLMNHQTLDRRIVLVRGGRLVRFRASLRPGIPIHNGTELFRVWTDPPEAEVEMKTNLTAIPSLESGDPLFPTLQAMGRLVDRIVKEFLPLWAEHLAHGLSQPPEWLEVE